MVPTATMKPRGWTMAAQAKLPGTLPTPAQARSNLRVTRDCFREKLLVFEGYKERIAASKDEVKAANLEVEEAEADLLAAEEGSKEDIDASSRHGKAMRRKARAQTDLEKVTAARRLAGREMALAAKGLAAAREDVEAIRQGRRKP
jgi:hypothetical protein